jgi:cell division protein FtsW (lipid II flippase)
VLALALPVFLLAGFPMLGYGVAAAAWLVSRGFQLAAERRARGELARGNRRSALGAAALARLGRVWLAVLLVGIAERDAGLAAAVLSAVLFTFYLAGQGLAHLLERQEEH